MSLKFPLIGLGLLSRHLKRCNYCARPNEFMTSFLSMPLKNSPFFNPSDNSPIHLFVNLPTF